MSEETRFAKIREYLTVSPDATNNQVLEALDDPEITRNQINQVRHQLKRAGWQGIGITSKHLRMVANLRKEIGEAGIKSILETLREID